MTVVHCTWSNTRAVQEMTAPKNVLGLVIRALYVPQPNWIPTIVHQHRKECCCILVCDECVGKVGIHAPFD